MPRSEQPPFPPRQGGRDDRRRPPNGRGREGGRPPRPTDRDQEVAQGDGGERQGSGQRRAVPRGGTPRGLRPGEGARPRGGGQEKARGRRDREPPRLAAPGNDLLYGRNAVAEALNGQRRPVRLFVAEGVKEDDRLRGLLARAAEREVPVERVPRLMLDDIFPGANHQGIVLEAGPYLYLTLGELAEVPGTVLVLDHLQDPQNFGTLLRASEAAGVAGVVIAQDRAVAVTPAVTNASAGAVELLRIAQVPNVVRALEVLKEGGRWVIGLDGGPDAVDLFTADLPTPVVLVVGAEARGMAAAVRKACDLLVRLPMRGRIDSLNAATAGAIALYDLLRREPGQSHS